MQKKVLGSLLVMGMVYGAIPMAASAAVGGAADLTTINPDLLMTTAEATAWHEAKATFGPTDAGSPGWVQYYNWLTTAFEESGNAVDKLENTFDYNLFFIDDWANPTGVLGLTLDPDGAKIEIPVASSAQNSIPQDGVYDGFTTAPLAYFDSTPIQAPAAGSFAGKIMVVETPPFNDPASWTPQFGADRYIPTDYEYRSGPGPFPILYEIVSETVDNSFHNRWEFASETALRTWAIAGEAAGMIIISDLPWNNAYGLKQRTGEYPIPTLFLDRDNGAKVLEYLNANPGQEATIKLIADFRTVPTSNVMYFLPGANYGQPNDEFVVVATHTDSMALTQENGALGLLGVFKYFEQIPQAERPRTLLFYLDNRHFVTGSERAFLQEDLFVLHPELIDKGVAQISLEHMGELEAIDVTENGEFKMVPNGNVVWTYIGVQSNDSVIDALIEAIQDNGLERADVKCDTRPGVNGGAQMAVGSVTNAFRDGSEAIGKPSLNLAGNWPGAHTQIFTGMEWFSADLFVDQVAVGAQMVGYFMTASSQELSLFWGQTKDAIRDLADADVSASAKIGLLDECDVVFEAVKAGDFADALGCLNILKADVQRLVAAGDAQGNILALIDKSSGLLD